MERTQGDMKKRLVQFATKYLEISVHRFEKTCGLSNSYCNNSNVIGSNAKKKIMDAYPGLNIDWVITGKGQMLNEEYSNLGQSLATTKYFGNAERSRMLNQIKELKKELEFYKMLYEKERAEVRNISERIGALKVELHNPQKLS